MSIEHLQIRKFDIKEMDLNSKVAIIGKPGCFEKGTQILMYNGLIKPVEEVEVGDIVMGDDSTPRNVLRTIHDKGDMYKIKRTKGGEDVVVNGKHKLVLKCTGYNQHPKGEIIEITVNDFLQKSKTFQKRFKWFTSDFVNFENNVPLKIDPYILGLWLGDGSSNRPEFTTIDQEILEYLTSYFKQFNLYPTSTSKDITYYFRSIDGTKKSNPFINLLKENNLILNKHIPHIYKTSSKENRLKLLAGLIDTDGTYEKEGKYFEIIQKSKTLSDDIAFLCRSLGFHVNIRKCYKTCTNSKNACHTGLYYRISIVGRCEQVPTILKRKQAEPRSEFINFLVQGFTIESLGDGDYYGFTLDGNHRFLLGDFSVVRNSGKSCLIKDLLFQHRKRFTKAIIMSGTEGSTKFYQGMVPDLYIYDSYNQDAMDRVRIGQQRAVRDNGAGHPMNNCAIVNDDCMDDKDWIKHKTTKWLFKNGRHFDIFFLLAMQYALDIPPELRTCIDYIFILKEPQLKTRHKLHDNYAGMIPTFNMFSDILDNLTEDYHCMVIKNRKALSTNISDCVFWYKATVHEDDFSIVPKSVWRYAENHYNRHYISDEEEQELKKSTSQRYGRSGKSKTQFVVSKLQY